MKDYKIVFNNMDWEILGAGVKQKQVLSCSQRLRLLRFDDAFVEGEWCIKGHVGYVIEGDLTIQFAGIDVSYKAGDVLVISSGESNKHKAKIRKGKFVELFLVEQVGVL